MQRRKLPVSSIESDHNGNRQTDEREQGAASLVSTLAAEDRVTNDTSETENREGGKRDATSKCEPQFLAQPTPVVPSLTHYLSLVTDVRTASAITGLIQIAYWRAASRCYRTHSWSSKTDPLLSS